MPGSQHPELQQAEGEETVPDSACPPRLFTHCLHPVTSAKLGNFLARSAQPQERPLPLSQSEKGSAAAARGAVVVASSGHQGPRPCPHRCAAFLGLKIHSASATDWRLAPLQVQRRRRGRGIRPSAVRLASWSRICISFAPHQTPKLPSSTPRIALTLCRSSQLQRPASNSSSPSRLASPI